MTRDPGPAALGRSGWGVDVTAPTSETTVDQRDGFPIADDLPDQVRKVLLAEDSAQVRERLTRDIVGWLTTVSPDGRPQTAVISFLWDGHGILFYSQPNTAKIRNIALNRAVSFHLDCDPYGDHVVVVEGTARV
ncbi:MAG TPA: pyridoxamine 5'-phosphate oxidase family protein, partial [Candidatus Limnocylindrales bacterium]|nr:pyridoxamine 5'-phosphate oxidase family protein [Candidatus Limnocylindrales bacterium]